MTPSDVRPASPNHPDRHFRQCVLCTGPISIDHLVFEADASVDGHQLRYPSGNGVITSSIIAAMGIPTTIAGRVGDDSNGRVIRDLLQSHGVDVSELHLAPDLQTKIARNVISPHGEWRRESAEPAVVPYLTNGRPPSLDRFTHLHVGGLNGLVRSAPAATRSLIEAGRNCRLAASIGLSRRNFDADLFNELISAQDVVFCTAYEFRRLTSTESEAPEDVLSSAIASRFESCVITFGALGAIAKWKDTDCYYVSAHGCSLVHARIEVESQVVRLMECVKHPLVRASTPSVSTVGAGDVFAAVFLAASLSRYAIPDALRAADRAASLSVKDRTWDAWLARAPDIPALIRLSKAESL